MKKNRVYYFFVAVIFSVACSSCKKYPEGPSFSLRSKKERISNEWKIQQYQFNGADSTTFVKNYLFNGYRLVIDKNGEYSFNYNILIGSLTFPFNENGSWVFSSGKENVILTKKSGNTPAAAGSAASWEILRLKEKELWIKSSQNNDVVEVHFN